MSVCGYLLSPPMSADADKPDDVSMLAVDESLSLNGISMHHLHAIATDASWTPSMCNLTFSAYPLEHQYREIVVSQCCEAVSDQISTKHDSMAYRPYNQCATPGLPDSPPSAVMVHHRRLPPAHAPTVAAFSKTRTALQPEVARLPRDFLEVRPPGLAATHPSNHQSSVGQDGFSPCQTRLMLGQNSASHAWAPNMFESIQDHSVLPSSEPLAKLPSSLMGPPPVPWRREASNGSHCPSLPFPPTPPESPSTPLSSLSERYLPHTYLLDPMMLHSNAPTEWLYDANVDRRDTDIANGNVTSPLAMIGLPLGGMIEMANAYGPATWHPWERKERAG